MNPPCPPPSFDFLPWSMFGIAFVGLILQWIQINRTKDPNEMGRKLVIQKLKVYRNAIWSMSYDVSQRIKSLGATEYGVMTAVIDERLDGNTSCFVNEAITEADKNSVSLYFSDSHINNISFLHLWERLRKKYQSNPIRLDCSTLMVANQTNNWLHSDAEEIDKIIGYLEGKPGLLKRILSIKAKFFGTQ